MLTENFTARLAQANFASKDDMANFVKKNYRNFVNELLKIRLRQYQRFNE